MKQIELTQGLVAKVDDSCFERLSRHSWCLLDLRKQRHGLVYAQTRTKTFLVYMHHMVLPLAPGMVVDHKNGDGLDNQRDNLQLVTDGDNKKNRRGLTETNTTGANGVSWDKTRKRFKVDIVAAGKNKFIGRYKTIEEAIKARKAAELSFWGKVYFKDFHAAHR